MLWRPATPGFLVTLIATILLAVVSFSVPWFKSVFFLKAVVDFDGHNGTATFGVLGYCLETGGKTNCTQATVGYEFDPNTLLGNKTPVKIPEVIVKWLTYALVLHIVALVFAAGSAVFGLLAHIREMSMTCCSTCISGFGAAITMIAFIFDIAFFFLAKARINKVSGGSAQIGNAIWLTLAAWLLLFFAGCFYGFGRCCISNRPRGPRDKKIDPPYPGTGGLEAGKSEALRLDAVKAEADRKARQKQGEVGLPAFQEYDPTKPLTAHGYDDEDESYDDHPPPRRQASAGTYAPSHPGYAPAPAGTRAMDSYYNAPAPSTSPHPPPAAAAVGYPPQPSHAQYPSTQYNAYGGAAGNPQPSHDQYLSSGTYGHDQYPSNVAQENAYGHPTQDSTYYSAASHHQQPSYNPEATSYHAGGYMPSATAAAYPSSGTLAPSVPASTDAGSASGGVSPASYYPPTTQSFPASTVPGSMGRDDYTFSSTPPPPAVLDTSYVPYTSAPTPNPHDAPAANPRRQSTGPRGPRSPTSPTSPAYPQAGHYDSPPGYEAGVGAGASTATSAWPNEKR